MNRESVAASRHPETLAVLRTLHNSGIYAVSCLSAASFWARPLSLCSGNPSGCLRALRARSEFAFPFRRPSASLRNPPLGECALVFLDFRHSPAPDVLVLAKRLSRRGQSIALPCRQYFYSLPQYAPRFRHFPFLPPL